MPFGVKALPLPIMNSLKQFFLSFGILFLLSSAYLQSSAQGVAGGVTVSGTIISAEDNQPLLGVAVVVLETMQGVTSNLDGTYTIEAAVGNRISFSFLGYKEVIWTVAASEKSITQNITLEPETEAIDDVVVIAYGVRKKGTITGSVSTVKMEKVEKTPTAAFDQALQGQVPGLTVLSNTGEPSAAAVMTIRGTNSINSGTAPLYILDGVPIAASDFNTINPADIESISVLKDASSTSIYGARAANGVIVITTKRGKAAERPRIEYRMQLGFSQVACGKWDLMNTAERIEYERQIGLDEGQNYKVLSQINTNWMDVVFNSSAMLQNYELAVSGADEKTS